MTGNMTKRIEGIDLAVLAEVATELARARQLHPEGANLLALAEETGEACRAELKEDPEARRKEIAQTVVVGLRLLMGEELQPRNAGLDVDVRDLSPELVAALKAFVADMVQALRINAWREQDGAWSTMDANAVYRNAHRAFSRLGALAPTDVNESRKMVLQAADMGNWMLFLHYAAMKPVLQALVDHHADQKTNGKA